MIRERDTDKYPHESGRRRFVKGVVGSAAIAGVGTATTGAMSASTTATGEGGGRTPFFGIENVRGPAPRGMPMIPVEIDSEGYLKGLFPEWETTTDRRGREVHVAETEIAGYAYSVEWFQYCGIQNAPGLQPENADAQDEYFRYTDGSPYDWQNVTVEAGSRIHVDDFADYESWGNGVGTAGIGKPAKGTWRSRDVGASDGVIVVQVLRIPPDEFARMTENTDYPDWLQAASAGNFIAWMDKCTHFCCVPTFKGTEVSTRFDAGDRVYCACHQSVYDPYRIVRSSFVALPRPR